MVCELVCLPAIALLTWLADKLGFPQGVVGIFLGALLVGLAEVSSKGLKYIAKKKFNKDVLFPFQTAILTILYLIMGALILNAKII